MNKSEIKTGMVVEQRKGTRKLVINDYLVGDVIYGALYEYNEDLTSVEYKSLDIMKVFEIKEPTDLRDIFDDSKLELLWERKEFVQLTPMQAELLTQLHNFGFNWITRDCNGDLFAFDKKPYNDTGRKTWRPKKAQEKYNQQKIPKCFDIFPFVSFYATDPLNIWKLLNAKKEDSNV